MREDQKPTPNLDKVLEDFQKSIMYLSIILVLLVFICFIFLRNNYPFSILLGAGTGIISFRVLVFCAKQLFSSSSLKLILLLLTFLCKLTIILVIALILWYLEFNLLEFVIGLALVQLAIVISSIIHANAVIIKIKNNGKT